MELLEWLQRIVLGVELKNENFTLNQLPAIIVIIFLTVLIIGVGNFLDVIDRIIVSANPEGFHEIALSSFKMAFITTPAQLVIISLFREVKNPTRKYGQTFGALLAGFVVVVVMIHLLNNPLMENVSEFSQGILWFFPFLMVIIVRLGIRQELTQ